MSAVRRAPWRLLALCAACLPLACGEPDQRAFAVENALFVAWYQGFDDSRSELTTARRERVAAGLSAICRGETGGTLTLLREAGIGRDIHRLALVAAKADRKGRCDYADWPDKAGLHGERIKQLVHQGDGPAVLLAALLDAQLSAAQRLEMVEALAARRYGQAEAVLAALRLQQGQPPDAERLRAAEGQGVALASLLLASAASGGDEATRCLHWQRAGRLLPGLTAPDAPVCR